MALEIETEGMFHHTLTHNKVVLADFYAEWCEPCKWLDKILVELEKELPLGTEILKIDVEKHQKIALGFEIRSVPVIIIFKDGSEVWRINGFLMKDGLLEKLMEFSRET